jgi:hypothetical protein
LGGKSYLTTFKLADKQTASSYSFCWEPHELIAFCSKELGWRLEAALRSPAEVVTKPSLSVSLCASGEVLVNGFVFCKAERSGSVDED